MRSAFLLAAVPALLLAFAGACSDESPTGGSSGLTTIDIGCPTCACTCTSARITVEVPDSGDCAAFDGTPCDPTAYGYPTDGGPSALESCTLSVYICG